MLAGTRQALISSCHLMWHGTRYLMRKASHWMDQQVRRTFHVASSVDQPDPILRNCHKVQFAPGDSLPCCPQKCSSRRSCKCLKDTVWDACLHVVYRSAHAGGRSTNRKNTGFSMMEFSFPQPSVSRAGSFIGNYSDHCLQQQHTDATSWPADACHAPSCPVNSTL